MTESTWILNLDSANATLENAGGKGANLAKLARAGFPVPGGFIIATQAYREFVRANTLGEKIAATLAALKTDDPDALEAASSAIRKAFGEGTTPETIDEGIVAAYRALCRSEFVANDRFASPTVNSAERSRVDRASNTPFHSVSDYEPQVSAVAVRSSATAEDLPELSFAGQQDTYLNIVGAAALLKAVVNCWSSLWTARAIGYRARNHIAHDDAALAVIVQAMVQSEASGVLFTANPLTGLRAETVIDATLGLGEALVSGQVEPDNYVVDMARKIITTKTLGAKAIVLRGKSGGGTVTQDQNVRDQPALSDAQIIELAELGKRVAQEYGSPQDIEWAWADSKLFLLQSRAITSLYPLPQGMLPEPFRAMFSFGAVQGMLDPLTPLAQDMVRLAFAGGGTLFGFHVGYQAQKAAQLAGERVWIDFTAVARHPIGHRVMPTLFGYVEAGARETLEALLKDPRLQPEKQGIKFSTLRRLARFALPALANIIRNWSDPDQRPDEIRALTDRGVAEWQARHAAMTGTRAEKLTQRVKLFAELDRLFPDYVMPVVYGLAAGMGAFNFLVQLATRATGSDALALAITRGAPHNVTTEMDLALWQTAKEIRAERASFDYFLQHAAPELVHDYLNNRLPTVAQAAAAKFLGRYGMRGLAEIDLGRGRWREDPTPVFQSLASYLRIDDQTMAPDVVFARGTQQAAQAAQQLKDAVYQTPHGWLKARIVHWAVRRVRAFIGLRESPKFYIIRRLGVVRQGLLDSGKEFVDAGFLNQPDDIFFLTLADLQAFARGESRDWKQIVAEHRATYAREKMRRQIPRILLSDGRAFYKGVSDAANANGDLRGSPVSPGVVEGSAHIVFDPHNAQLAPGEILVCPGTDPAWTPLFLSAGGLVMEVGGLMTHGAVVAREYGIPAVVGVHQATTRLKTGQRIRVNGTTGVIKVLERT